MPIQFATGVRTKNYKQFATGVCANVEIITITYSQNVVLVTIGENLYIHDLPRFEREPNNTPSKLNELAINDGFKDFNEFLKYFNKDFKGKIIHF